jgi:hypothetical protein
MSTQGCSEQFPLAHKLISYSPQPSYRRLLSSASEVAPPSSSKRGGFAFSGVFQRLSSFLVGAGLTALGTQYYIYNEIRDGNLLMLDKQKELEARLAKLESASSTAHKK